MLLFLPLRTSKEAIVIANKTIGREISEIAQFMSRETLVRIA